MKIRIVKEIAGHRIGARLRVGLRMEVTDTQAAFFVGRGFAEWEPEPGEKVPGAEELPAPEAPVVRTTRRGRMEVSNGAE